MSTLGVWKCRNQNCRAKVFTESNSEMCPKCMTEKPKPTFHEFPGEEEKKREVKRKKIAEERKGTDSAAAASTTNEEEKKYEETK